VALRDIQRFTRARLAEAGAPGVKTFLLDLQPTLVDAYFQATVAGFEYPRSDLAPTVRFVGPILAPPSTSSTSSSLPEWWPDLLSDRPVVHVTQGTLDNADLGRLLLLTVDALAGDDVLVVATTGGPDPEPFRAGLPENARLERFIPHDLLLPHVDAMVTNGGYGGVQQALALGVPLVVAGDSEDKPEVAARVQWSGVGINLHTGKPSKAMVARAVRRVLTRPSYRARAQVLQEEIVASDPLRDITAGLAELCASEDVTAPPAS
jgi:UDP:flavonoid glycosyltransferase YjiC (YdhE family)